MNTITVILTGKAAKLYVAQYGYTDFQFDVVRIGLENGKVRTFSIKIPKEKTGFGADTVADFAGKEGRINGLVDFTF